MNLLAVHTTDARGSIAVDAGGRVVEREFAATGARAASLVGEIHHTLAAAGLELADCTALAVTTGPGSFTGIRVGLATVQGLAAARVLPVWACGSLCAQAAAWRHAAGDVLAVVVDARRGEVFAALYDVRDDVPRPLEPPFCAAPEPAAARLLAAGGAAFAVCGSGAELVALPGARRLDRAPVTVAAALARLARAGGCRSVAARDLEPEYLRKSDAELQRRGPRGPKP